MGSLYSPIQTLLQKEKGWYYGVTLPELGFRIGKKYFNHESENIKVNAETGEIGITSRGRAAYAVRVPNTLLHLANLSYLEEA